LIPFAVGLLLCTTACQKETDVYQVNTFHVRNESAVKGTQKSSLELISIAYFDLFGKEIAGQELNNLMIAYASFGDKQVMTERIIQNFLARKDADIPSDSRMRKNVREFVEATYRRFYTRKPDEQELQTLTTLIETAPEITPSDVYYAFLTSNEYLYY
jgi:hypothetical protein